MHRPRIGIPLCLDARGRWRPGHEYLYVDRRYAACIEAAGGLPVQLPIQRHAEALVEGLDGLLLPGGDDLPAAEPLPESVQLDLVPEAQLRFDAALLRAALDRSLPTLGICYGMQLLAREAGGSLHDHLPTRLPEAAPHRLDPENGRHGIVVEAESRLALVLGPGPHEVNSLHHQAVREPGRGLRAVAFAPDGVIEAIEAADADGPFRIGVQWHPEKLSSESSDRLFEAFVAASAERIGLRAGHP